MNALTLQATFCGLLHGLGKLAFRADKTAADLLADLPDTPEWAAVRGGAAAGSDAARCAAFARSLSVTADTPAAEPASTRYRPLRSIFSHLNGEHPGYSVPAARPDGALHDPVQDAPDIPAAVYRELYQELTEQLTSLQFSPAQANALLGLLESQCSALPASTAREEDRDISLYDQLKLTAALAACVSEYLQQADAFSLLDTPAELRREPAFLLYTADFSRIQRFIYTVHTEDALRSLRSRSFFLELLMEHYMDELLDGCGLTRTNIIYSGGGHCYLLLPNTAAVQQTLADWNRAFNGWLNEQFGVQLFLANGWTPCSANDLCNVPAEASPYKALFRRVNAIAEQHKQHPYDAAALRALNRVQAIPDGTRECKVCGNSAQVNAEGLCPWCNRFANLSAQIQNQSIYLVHSTPRPSAFAQFQKKDDDHRGNSMLYNLTDLLRNTREDQVNFARCVYLLARRSCVNGETLPDFSADGEVILRMFGGSEPVRSARLQFADAFLLNYDQLKGVGVTEVKSENVINRLTSMATHRQIERVIAGSRFGVNIVYNLSDPKEMEEDLSLLSKAMKLLQLDYLGGHGSRGNGRVSFQNFQVIPYPETLNVDLDGIRQTFKTEVEEYELFSAKTGV